MCAMTADWRVLSCGYTCPLDKIEEHRASEMHLNDDPMACAARKWGTVMDYRPGITTLETAVFEALGAASVCWENMSGTGVFQSDRAKQIGEELVEFIRGQGGLK